MINVTELRIGNWVHLSDLKDPIKILGIHEPYGWYNLGRLELEHIYPIPLTPEIIKKCDFRLHSKKYSEGWWDKDGDGYWEYTYIFRDGIRSHEYITHMIGTDNFKCAGVQIECLHYLQNMYFALSRKELEYTPDFL